MRVQEVINNAVYYGSAMIGGIAKAVEFESEGAVTMESGLRIAAAAAVSAGAGAMVKEVVTAVFIYIKNKFNGRGKKH